MKKALDLITGKQTFMTFLGHGWSSHVFLRNNLSSRFFSIVSLTAIETTFTALSPKLFINQHDRSIKYNFMFVELTARDGDLSSQHGQELLYLCSSSLRRSNFSMRTPFFKNEENDMQRLIFCATKLRILPISQVSYVRFYLSASHFFQSKCISFF